MVRRGTTVGHPCVVSDVLGEEDRHSFPVALASLIDHLGRVARLPPWSQVLVTERPAPGEPADWPAARVPAAQFEGRFVEIFALGFPSCSNFNIVGGDG